MLPTTHNDAARGLLASPFANMLLSTFPAMLAGAAWLGLAGMALGTGFALSAEEWRWTEDVWFGPVFGLALGAHCGLWAGLLYAYAAKGRRILLTTLAAGLSEPLIWNFWEGYDPPFSWTEWVSSTLIYGLPFVCGWLFARAMSGNTRLPLMGWARAALATGRPAALRSRLLAGTLALVLGYAALAVATTAVAFIGFLLPLAPSDFAGMD